MWRKRQVRGVPRRWCGRPTRGRFSTAAEIEGERGKRCRRRRLAATLYNETFTHSRTQGKLVLEQRRTPASLQVQSLFQLHSHQVSLHFRLLSPL